MFKSEQCLYFVGATKVVQAVADELKKELTIIELKSAENIRKLSPSAYGTFSIVYNETIVLSLAIEKRAVKKNPRA